MRLWFVYDMFGASVAPKLGSTTSLTYAAPMRLVEAAGFCLEVGLTGSRMQILTALKLLYTFRFRSSPTCLPRRLYFSNYETVTRVDDAFRLPHHDPTPSS